MSPAASDRLPVLGKGMRDCFLALLCSGGGPRDLSILRSQYDLVMRRLKPSRRGGHDLNCLAPDNFPTNCDCLTDDGGSYSTEPTSKLTIEIEFALESDNFILM